MKGFEEDREKINEAQILGWLVLEVTPAQAISGMVFHWVERVLLMRGQRDPESSATE